MRYHAKGGDGGQLDGKTALVTGVRADIGLATARRMADEGAHVLSAARNQSKIDGAVADIGVTRVWAVCLRVRRTRTRGPEDQRAPRHAHRRGPKRTVGGSTPRAWVPRRAASSTPRRSAQRRWHARRRRTAHDPQILVLPCAADDAKAGLA